MERVYRLIVDRPKLLLLLLLLLTGFFAYHAQHIRLDGSVDSLLPANDPNQEYYQQIRQLFEGIRDLLSRYNETGFAKQWGHQGRSRRRALSREKSLCQIIVYVS